MSRRARDQVPVWDRVVRISHWALVASVALSTLGTVMLFGVHRPAGYVALVIVLARTGWGVIGSRYARFTQFVRAPRATCRYAMSVARGTAPRHLGHNPLGAWMALALMLCIAALAFTGWLYTTDALWGDETVERLHRALAWTLLGLVSAHVVGVIGTSLRHRENLVVAMWKGSKRAPAGDDIA